METQDSNFRLVYSTDHSFLSPHCTAGKDNVPKVMGTNVRDIETENDYLPKNWGQWCYTPGGEDPGVTGNHKTSQPCYFLAIHYLFDSFHQSVLVESHGLGALMEVVLVAETELQHLLKSSFSSLAFVGEV